MKSKIRYYSKTETNCRPVHAIQLEAPYSKYYRIWNTRRFLSISQFNNANWLLRFEGSQASSSETDNTNTKLIGIKR